MKFLFIGVPEVKIEIGHRCLPSVAQGHDILYDRGAELMMSVHKGGMSQRRANQTTLFPEPAIETEGKKKNDQGLYVVKAKSYARFPCNHKKGSVDFH